MGTIWATVQFGPEAHRSDAVYLSGYRRPSIWGRTAVFVGNENRGKPALECKSNSPSHPAVGRNNSRTVLTARAGRDADRAVLTDRGPSLDRRIYIVHPMSACILLKIQNKLLWKILKNISWISHDAIKHPEEMQLKIWCILGETKDVFQLIVAFSFSFILGVHFQGDLSFFFFLHA